MLIQDNLILSRAEPSGNGGVQFLYRIGKYGVACVSRPREDVAHIDWEVDVIKYKNDKTVQYDLCHTTDLAKKTLRLRNDKVLNEFLQNAFDHFKQIQES